MATTIEQIQQLMQELGPASPDIDAVVQTEEPSWAIQFSDESIMVIEPADEPARLVLSSELGTAPEAAERQLYEALLSYNLLWRDSGGLKIGLAGPKGSLIINWELCLEGLTLLDLQSALARFRKVTASWQHYVASADVGTAPLPGLDGGSFHLHA
jgi:hypothetical protein